MRTRNRPTPARRAVLPILLLAALLAIPATFVVWALTDRPDPDGAGEPPTSTADPGPEQTEPTDDATPTPDPTPSEPEQLPDAEFTIGAVGDVLPHATVTRTARTPGGYDYTPMLEATRAWSEGVDLALCNLESPLIPPDQDPSGFPMFGAPQELGQNLADLGWDGCSTGNNHALDRGYDNVVHTLDVLDEVEMGHAGTARSQAEALEPQLYELERAGQQVTVAQLGGTDSTNGLPIPAEAPWAVTLIDAGTLIEQARTARADGADLVIATLHWGTEYVNAPIARVVGIAEELAQSGQIDLVIGHHPHVPQPFAKLDGGPDGEGMWVAYSLGNFISNQDEACCVPQTANGLFMTASVSKPDGEPARVTGLEWTVMTVDRVGDQRVYPLHDLREGDRPELLTLSAGQLEARHAMVSEVMANSTGAQFTERTEAPEPTGEPAVVQRRGD